MHIKLNDERRAVFTRRLREAYTKAGIYDANELADLLDVSANTARSWMAGRSEPSVENVSRICEVLGVNANWLLGIDEK